MRPQCLRSVTAFAGLMGPALIPLRGGSAGFWLESTGALGVVTAVATGARLGATACELVAE